MRPVDRRGFTLTELLIVIGILLLLATMSLAVYSNNKNSDRLRSAARVAQSAFLGAKDRAMHAKQLRGVRLVRDANGPAFANGIPCLVNGFAFIQPVAHDPYPAGSIQLERVDLVNNSNGNAGADGQADGPDVVVVHGATGQVDWSQVSSWFANGGQIRIPAATGQWYQFTFTTTGPYALGANNEYLQLVTPFSGSSAAAMPATVAFPFTNATSNSCEIQFGNEVLPFHQPIALPAGTIVDLRYSSASVQFLAGSSLASGSTAPNIDISFSPRGSVSGAVGGLGAIYFCLRELGDATTPSLVLPSGPRDPSDPACVGECLILALNPSTGLVQTYPADLTDAYINASGASGSDGYADNLFSYAQQGKAAGR